MRVSVQKKEWFERWFGEEYKALYPHRDEAQAATQVGAVARAAKALPAWRILDVGCGAGRHLRALRQAGLTAFGADLSPVLIRDARLSGLNVCRADMRRLPFRDQAFQLVTCFFTSFGYFATAEEDAKSQEKFESDARTGALGVEWQRVQQRIDLGQTTLADVMSGADETQAARALRDRAESRLTELHDELVIEEESDETDDDPLTQVTQMQRDLAARLEELRIRTEEWDERR